MDIQLSSLPERINLYLNSANRTRGESASSFEMVMANTLITADTDEIFFINVIQFNTFNNFYQVQTGYNTDFEIIIYNHDYEIHDTIVGTLPEGNLTIKGATKKVAFDVSYGGTVKDPYGNIKAGFKAKGSIKRMDYGLTWSALTEAGGMVVGDEVSIMFNIELAKAK
jgi:hypothetical protein